MSSKVETEINQVRAKTSRFNKAQGLKKEKVSSELEKEIKHIRAKSSRLDKSQGLKRKKREKQSLG